MPAHLDLSAHGNKKLPSTLSLSGTEVYWLVGMAADEELRRLMRSAVGGDDRKTGAVNKKQCCA